MGPKLISLTIAVCLSLGTTGAAFAETGVTDKEVLIGTLGMKSGPSEFYGRQTDIGVDALVESVNAQGGVFGRKIRTIHEDDGYDADRAIVCFNHAVSQGVFGFTGLVGSPTLARYLPMCMSNKIPAVGAYSGPNFACDPVKKYFFNSRPPYREEMRQDVEHLWNDLGIRKIAVIYQNDSFGADLLEGVRQALKAHAVDLVAAGSYTRNTSDVGEAINSVKAADPQAVIIAGVFKPAIQIFKTAKEMNWHPIFIMSSGSSVDAMADESGGIGDGSPTSEVTPPYVRTDFPAVANYRKALEKYFPKEKPNYCSLKGYIDAMIFVEALKRTGKDLTREKFVSALEGMKRVDLGLGKGNELSYTPEDHWGFHKVFYVTTRNGEVVGFEAWKKLAARK